MRRREQKFFDAKVGRRHAPARRAAAWLLRRTVPSSNQFHEYMPVSFGFPTTEAASSESAAASSPIFAAKSSAVREGARLHLTLGDEGRNVTVLRHQGKLHCFDSVCYHAGGPLGAGDIEDVDGKTCISCPWHTYKVTLDTGEKLYRATEMVDGRPVPIGWTSAGVKQRVHGVADADDGNVYVTLRTDGEVESDKYGCRERDQNRRDCQAGRGGSVLL